MIIMATTKLDALLLADQLRTVALECDLGGHLRGTIDIIVLWNRDIW